jgi:CTP synthase (UTP-ammonia lyase)
MGLADADSAENGTDSRHIVITPVVCAVPNRNPGDPKLVGAIPEIQVKPGTILYSIYGHSPVREEHFCNYEVNPEYERQFEAAGLRVAARGADGELKAFELPARRFFVATLYQPQLESSQPHPVVTAFVKAATAFAEASRLKRVAV